MDRYLPRVADGELEAQLEASGAVLIEGPKWCGKTTTARRHAASEIVLQRSERMRERLRVASIRPETLLDGATPRLIDEWQILPTLWDDVRDEVDLRGTPGQFILTGSATPPDRGQIHHSGTGRIARLRMRPMSLAESGESSGDVSLTALFDGGEASAREAQLDIERLAFLACRGGWPYAIALGEQAALRQARNYLSSIIETDLVEADGVRRSPEIALRILRSYGRLVSSEATETTIVADVGASSATVRSYLQALRDIFVFEDLAAWNPNVRSKVAIRQRPVRHFTDPSIACAALGLGPGALAQDLNTLGLIFEDLCVRDLRVYAQALDGRLYHYRDKTGLECDAVICLLDGRYGLVEVKLGGDALIDEGRQSLLKLRARIDQERMGPPSFCMVLTGVSSYCYTDEDGVSVVPIDRLGP